ncbi:MAG: protein translocase subunit SecF [Chloroflexi bacterium]|nr:protein translocase subunit SecF [Chloroflexota bacterium]
MFDFISKRNWFFLVSGIIIIAGVIALIVAGLNTGIEFSSGSTMTLVFKEPVQQADLRAAFAELNHSEAIIQHSSKDAYFIEGIVLEPAEKEKLIDDLQAKFDTTIRIAEFEAAGNETSGNETQGNETLALLLGKTIDRGDLSSALTDLGYSDFDIEFASLNSFLIRTRTLEADEGNQVERALEQKFGSVSVLDFYSVSAVIAGERVRYTVYAMIVASVGILLYIAWAFRKVASSFRFGVCAIIALIHDVLILLAIFAFLRIQIDSMFIIAMMTVVGYGVNNIIVVFDRIRENRSRHLNADLGAVVNISITETLTRSLNTSLTTLFVLIALYAFGGATIQNFVLALLVGIIASTYSSICIAAQLLIAWENGDFAKLFRWIPLRRQRS